MRFSLSIDCDNAAFEGTIGRDIEIGRILADLARKAHGQGLSDGEGFLFDENGNRVGSWRLEAEA